MIYLNDAVSKWLDLTFIIIFMVISCIGLNLLLREVNTPLVSKHEDKSALYVENAIHEPFNIKTGSDIMLSLLVADDYCPEPASIRINNTPIIRIDDDYVASKYTEVNKIYNTSGQWQLGRLLNSRVIYVTYVTDSSGDYWQYIIE